METAVGVQNVVSRSRLGYNLRPDDLLRIAREVWNVEYRPDTFNGLIMRIKSLRATALVFPTGVLVCYTSNMERNRPAARKFARIIQKTGFPVTFQAYSIVNVSGSCDVGFPVDLDRMSTQYCHLAVYSPELFPAMVFRMTSPRVSAIIFCSGKVLVVGAKLTSHLNLAMERLSPILKEFSSQ